MALSATSTEPKKDQAQAAALPEGAVSAQPVVHALPDPDRLEAAKAALLARKRSFASIEIAEMVYEGSRIINPDSSQGVAFQRIAQKIAAKLYPDHDFRKEPVAFVLYESKSPNAFFLNQGVSGPMIGVSIGFFKPTLSKGQPFPPLVSSIDSLASIISHEWKHYKLRGMTNHSEPTKQEEMKCYYESLEATLNAGFDPRAELRMARQIGAMRQLARSEVWQATVDAHLLPQHEAHFVEAGLTMLSESRGGFGGVAETPLAKDDELLNITTARHESWVDEMWTRLDIGNQPLKEQVNSIVSIIDQGDWARYSWRIPALAKKIEELKLSGEECAPLVLSLIDTIFSTAEQSTSAAGTSQLYTAVYRAYKNDMEAQARPIGRIAKVSKALGAFVKASGEEDIADAADKVVRLVSQEPLFNSAGGRALLQSMEWRSFPAPRVPRSAERTIRSRHDFDGACDDEFQKYVSFEEHVSTAMSGRHRAVTQALLILQIDDPRLFNSRCMSAKTACAIQKGLIPKLGRMPWTEHVEECLRTLMSSKLLDGTTCLEDFLRRSERERAGLLANVAGNTIGTFEFDIYETEGIVSEHDEAKRSRDRFLRDTGPSTLTEDDFDLLASAPREFFKKHGEILAKSFTSESLVAHKVGELAAQDPETWRPILRDFFAREPYSYLTKGDPTKGLFFSLFDGGGTLAERNLNPNTSPFVTLLYRLPESVLTASEKLGILGAGFSPASTAFPVQFKTLRVSQRASITAAVAPVAKEAFPKIFSSPLSGWAQATSAARTILEKEPDALPFLQLAIMDLVKRRKPTLAQSLKLAQVTRLDFHPSFVLDLYDAFPRDHFERQLGSQPVQQLLSQWSQLHAASLLPAAVKHRYLSQMLVRLNQEPSEIQLSEYIKLLTIKRLETPEVPDRDDPFLQAGIAQFGFAPTDVLNPRLTLAPIAEPTIRLACIKRVAESFGKVHGQDDGSAEYSTRVDSLLNELKESQNALDFSLLLQELAKATCAQPALCKALEGRLPEVDTFDLKKSAHVSAFEFVLAAAKNRPDIASSVVDFLVGDGSEQSFKILDDTLVEADMELPRTLTTFADTTMHLKDMLEQNEKEAKHEAESRGEELTPERQKELEQELVRSEHVDRRERIEEYRLVYLHFWSLPMEARAVVARELLPDAPEGTSEANPVPPSFDSVASRMFPENKEHSQDARDWLREYILVLPEFQRPLMLAACLTAARRNAQEDLPVGEVLATLLENLGPGPIKAGQAGSCHPDLPEGFRAPLRRLKYSADAKPRWEYLNWLKSRMPAEDYAAISHFGPVLGEASLWVTLQVKRSMGNDRAPEPRVIGLLRPHAAQRLEYGCDNLLRLANRMKNEQAGRICGQLVKEGLRGGRLEIDSQDALTRHHAAQQQYEAEKIIVDGEHFLFSAAPVLSAGEGYKEMPLVEGRHIAEILADEQEPQERREKLAMAFVTRELSFILRGMPFCNDRHGGNARCSANSVGHFDLGSFEISSPSEQDMKDLAGVVLRVAQSFSGGGTASSLATKIDEHCQKIQSEFGRPSPYLMRVQKALLSLGDCISALSSEACVECIAAAASAGMHPVLQGELLQQVLSNPDLMTSMQGLSPSGRVEIQKVPGRISAAESVEAAGRRSDDPLTARNVV